MRPNFFYKILITSFTLSTFSEGIILPIYAVFVQRVGGGTILDAGYAMGIFLITSGVFTAIVHRVKWSKDTRIILMIVGWAIWLVGIASYLLINNIATLFLAQVLTAIGDAVADPAFEVELTEHTDEVLKEYEWGLFDGSRDVVNGIAAILGGIIVSVFGFRILIYLMIIAATISFFMIIWYAVEVRKAKSLQLVS